MDLIQFAYDIKKKPEEDYDFTPKAYIALKWPEI